MADGKKEGKDAKKAEADKGAPAKEKDASRETGGEDAAAEDGGAKAKPKIPKKTLIIAGAAGGGVLLVVIIVLVLMLTGVFGGKKEEAPEAAVPTISAAGGHGKKDEARSGEAVFYDLGEMVVNLASDGKRRTFLKLVVQLELESTSDKDAIEALKPRIVDNFQTYLRELRVDDLKGSAGLYRLREELLFRVTEAVYPIKIRDVLFQQMLVQ